MRTCMVGAGRGADGHGADSTGGTGPAAEAARIWSTGEYRVIGNTLQMAGERLCESADLRAGERVLDVATGTGSAALAAARRFALVVGVDIVPSMLDVARGRAAAEGFAIEFALGDATALAYADGSFDVVLSCFGVMFAGDRHAAARELVRVCRRGGRVALASWTPESFVGEIFDAVRHHTGRPAHGPSPLDWGTGAAIDALFAGAAARIQAAHHSFVFRYRSPAHWLAVFRTCYGPLATAYAALDTKAGGRLTAALLDIVRRSNCATDGTVVVPAEYLEVVVSRA